MGAPMPQEAKQPLPGWARLAIAVVAIAVGFVLLAGVLGVVVYFRAGGSTQPRALVAVGRNRDDRRPELLTRLCPGRSVGTVEARDGGPTGPVVWSARAAGSPGLQIVPMSGPVPNYTIVGDARDVPEDRVLWIAVRDDLGAPVGADPIEVRAADLSSSDVNIGNGADGVPSYQQRVQFVKQIEC